jgi:general secretion pathway protein D
VQYLDTGTILKVRPRVTKDGTVFVEMVQEVSAPRGEPDDNGNVRISTNRMKTSAVIQSGDTVLLAGLITDSDTKGSSGFPGLSRLPVVGGLFGRQSSTQRRSEIIILITPTLVEDPRAARDLTDEYSRRFRGLQPLPKADPPEPQPHR